MFKEKLTHILGTLFISILGGIIALGGNYYLEEVRYQNVIKQRMLEEKLSFYFLLKEALAKQLVETALEGKPSFELLKNEMVPVLSKASLFLNEDSQAELGELVEKILLNTPQDDKYFEYLEELSVFARTITDNIENELDLK